MSDPTQPSPAKKPLLEMNVVQQQQQQQEQQEQETAFSIDGGPVLLVNGSCDLSKEEGWDAFVEDLEKHKHKSVLEMWMTKLGDEGAARLGRMLPARIESLRLTDNGIGPGGVGYLTDALSCLRMLHLAGNPIGNEGATVLARALRHNTSVTQVFLSRNGVGPPGARALAAMLHHNRTLTSLDFFSNPVGDGGAVALAESLLRHNRTLRSLALKQCRVGLHTTRAFRFVVRHNRCLHHVHLRTKRRTAAMDVCLHDINHYTKLNEKGFWDLFRDDDKTILWPFFLVELPKAKHGRGLDICFELIRNKPSIIMKNHTKKDALVEKMQTMAMETDHVEENNGKNAQDATK